MPVIVIALLVGGALLLMSKNGGLGGLTGPSQAQQQTQQGASVIAKSGGIASQLSSQGQAINENLNATEVKTLTAAAGAGVSAGYAAAGTAGVSSGVVTGAVTFGIGAVIGIAVVLYGKHKARIKGAKNENALANSVTDGWKEAFDGIVAQHNSGQITDLEAAGELQQLRDLVFTDLLKDNHQPGVNWHGGGDQPGNYTTKYWTVPCSKHCTVSCCIFNNVLGPALNNAIQILQGKIKTRTFQVPALSSSKYGFRTRPAFMVTLK